IIAGAQRLDCDSRNPAVGRLCCADLQPPCQPVVSGAGAKTKESPITRISGMAPAARYHGADRQNHAHLWLPLHDRRVADRVIYCPGAHGSSIFPRSQSRALVRDVGAVPVILFVRRSAGLRGRRAVYLSSAVFLLMLCVWAANIF